MMTLAKVVTVLAAIFAIAAGSPIESADKHRSRRAITDITPQNRTSCQPGATPPPTRVDTTARLAALRATFTNSALTGVPHIDALIIPTDDAHQSEYVSKHDQRRVYISGFAGSAGVAVVLQTKAALWTDGRYFLEGDKVLDCNWIFMKSGMGGVPSRNEWLTAELPPNSVVGANPSLLPVATWQSYETALKKSNITLQPIYNDLIDAIWTDQPPAPNSTIFVHDVKYAGKSWQDKVSDIRVGKMAEKKADVLVVTDLMEVAWLYNLRADDIAYNPVFTAYAMVMTSELRLYLAPGRVTDSVRIHLNTKSDGSCTGQTGDCVRIMDYANIFTDIKQLSDDSSISKIWVSKQSSYGCYSQVAMAKLESDYNPIALIKSIKNSVERVGMQNSHNRDAVALISFMAFLEQEIADGKEYTEISAADKLEEYRRAQVDNRGLSFTTISSVGANGAIIHYSPTPQTNAKITTSDLYLLDSGGQYLDGTTDVTRTFHFGEPTDFEKEAYTRVLMGSIDLARAVWPEGVYGRDIDAFARGPLWRAGLDYRHGTGHGIGHFLSVHEGPARIRIGYREHEQPMYVGMFFSDGPSFIGTKGGVISPWFKPIHVNMFLSDEPGYYEDGKFGVRLETIVQVVEADTPYKFGGKTYMGFKEVTLVPFESKLIQLELLNTVQRQWLNAYHKRCRETIGPLLKEDAAKSWLNERTQAVDVNPTIGGAGSITTSVVLCIVSVLSAVLSV